MNDDEKGDENGEQTGEEDGKADGDMNTLTEEESLFVDGPQDSKRETSLETTCQPEPIDLDFPDLALGETETKQQLTPTKRKRRTKAEMLAAAPQERRASSRISKLQADVSESPKARGGPGRPARGLQKSPKQPPETSGPPRAPRACNQEWEVEAIMGSRICADTHRHFYEVKWKGFSHKENTWEPKSNLGKCQQAIAELERRMKKKKKK